MQLFIFDDHEQQWGVKKKHTNGYQITMLLAGLWLVLRGEHHKRIYINDVRIVLAYLLYVLSI